MLSEELFISVVDPFAQIGGKRSEQRKISLHDYFFVT